VTKSFRELLREKVVVIDGAMGTSIHSHQLDLARDFGGLENCCEIVNERRPDVIRSIHASFLRVGCDAVETNTFGAMPHVLREFGLEERCVEINTAAVAAARAACAEFATPARPRYVLGSIGPGTKLATLGQITYAELKASYLEQALALARAGADGFAIETVQDPLQAKAAINACLAARAESGRDLALLVSVTMEVTGTMLVGTEMAAAIALLDPYPIDVLALNCATGPREMSTHVRVMGQTARPAIGCYPNAGLPQLVDGKTHYPLTPAELADWLVRFVEEDGLALVGGCCGTTPEHLAAVVRAMEGRVPKRRKPSGVPQVTSLYHAVDLKQESSILIVGERSNANGSKQFREHLLSGAIDSMVEMGKEQLREGSHALDLCAAYVGRDEQADMVSLLRRYRTEVAAPLSIDTTEPPVLKAALELTGGRSIVNSINLEDGMERAGKILPLAREHGAALIALTIDEEGMAKSVEDKVRIARRIHDLALDHGLRPEDLLFDVLTFTICTGSEDDRRHGLNTLEGVRRVREELPGVGTLLGVSNISFGLKPAARHALNSVFLHHAQEAGLSAAILHAGRITPLHKLDPEVRQACEDLIHDRRREGYDPLQRLMQLCEGVALEAKKQREVPEDVFLRLRWRIVEGAKVGLIEDLELARATKAPLAVINEDLLAGMGTVGELFGKGEMQLPFVLQSAETMKAAVAHLQPYLEKKGGSTRGKIVLATVRGDVHDIGKNLVDIILTNNGYTVYNLGIKQPIERILEVAQEQRPHAIGMSGLLVKSTVVMRENLEEMNRRGVDLPVILGGAALTRAYVEADCRATYNGPLYYAQDAFEGLDVMERIVAGEQKPDARTKKPGGKSAAQRALEAVEELERERGAGRPEPDEMVTVEPGTIRRAIDHPKVPFLGPRLVEGISLQTILPYINETTLFQFQWGYRRKGRSTKEHERFVAEVVRPTFHALAKQCEREKILVPKAAYGFWRCVPEGNTLVLLDPASDGKEAARFTFPRQKAKKRLCITDFFRQDGEPDVIGLQVVTVGQQASDTARDWFAADRYQDYLHLHGLSVEAAEGLAEYVHKELRAQLGIAGDDARELRELFKQGYRGSRYSFGYPACPNLADQETLLALLGAERLGLTLSEEHQLVPEQSTSAIVVHHPDAHYFTI